MLKDHIQTIVEHYRDAVFSWDVVNEAFEKDGSLHQTIWRDSVGDDYSDISPPTILLSAQTCGQDGYPSLPAVKGALLQ